jgi:hypothetical protein
VFRDLIRQSEIAERHGLSLQSVRRLAMDKDWPPVERQIGNVKFYATFAVDYFFETRIDRRQFNRRKPRKRRRK